MRKKNMQYESYIWKKLAKEELARELNVDLDISPDLIPDEDVEARALDLQIAFDEETTEEITKSAMAWLDGFEKMAADVEEGFPEGSREVMIFSILGSNLLVHLCEKLSVNDEHLTIQNQRDAAAMVREFSKIFMWIGRYEKELYKEVPSAK
jgi:hypothetical protein